jgi:hypothetical protein
MNQNKKNEIKNQLSQSYHSIQNCIGLLSVGFNKARSILIRRLRSKHSVLLEIRFNLDQIFF